MLRVIIIQISLGQSFVVQDYSIVTSILTSNTSSTSSPAPVQPSYTAWVGSCTANGTDVFSGATGASKLSTYPKLNAGNLVDIIGDLVQDIRFVSTVNI